MLGWRGHDGRSRVRRINHATVSARSANARFNTAGSASKRYAAPGTSSSARWATDARRRRRTRLRATAEPTRRPTAYATRGGSEGSSPGANRTDTGPRRRRGARARASKDARSRTRQIRPTAASGRVHAGNAGRLALRGSASGRGSRASSCACGCSAGTCASTGLPPRATAQGPQQGIRAGGGRRECTDDAGATRNARARSTACHTAGKPVEYPLSRLLPGGTFPRLAGLRPAAANFPGERGSVARAPPGRRREGARRRDPQRSPHLWTLLWTEEGGC